MFNSQGNRSMLPAYGILKNIFAIFKNIVHMEYGNNERWKTVTIHNGPERSRISSLDRKY